VFPVRYGLDSFRRNSVFKGLTNLGLHVYVIVKVSYLQPYDLLGM
jgi:hypothetical protein